MSREENQEKGLSAAHRILYQLGEEELAKIKPDQAFLEADKKRAAFIVVRNLKRILKQARKAGTGVAPALPSCQKPSSESRSSSLPASESGSSESSAS